MKTTQTKQGEISPINIKGLSFEEIAEKLKHQSMFPEKLAEARRRFGKKSIKLK
jgi:hypothetical protein